jgi:multiple sugar transport system permease protein
VYENPGLGVRNQRNTHPVGLTLLMGQYNYQWNQIMAMSVLGCLPVVILFLIFQRHFVSGLSSGAVKA